MAKKPEKKKVPKNQHPDDNPKKKRKEVVEVDSDEAKKSAYGKGLGAPMTIPGFNTDNELDAIERKIGVGSAGIGAANEARMSTGMLVYDLILGGGLTAGWYTNFGAEQSCKSTSTMTIAASAVAQGIPIVAQFDFEGSTQSTYVQNILNTNGIEASVADVYGVRDLSGNYVKKPRIRYVSVDAAESFFDYVQELETKLPDKIFAAGGWWYVYQNTNENRKRLKDDGIEYDAKMFKKHNKFYVPAQDGSLQALIIVDSYPAMLPERLMEDSEAGGGLGAVARMFAENIPKIKPRMRKKRICVLGVNQLRLRPMAKGNPEYEPGGQAVRFYSDARIKHTSRAISAVAGAKQMADGPHEQESSVEYQGTKDTYRYVALFGEKNKLSQPYLKSFIRLWIADGKGQARGFDPVFDTFNYLQQTGQIKNGSKHRKAFTLQVAGNEASKPMDWEDFKLLILGDKKDMKAVCEKVKMKPCNLRKYCFKQIAKKEGLELYFKKLNKIKEDGEDEESDAEE